MEDRLYADRALAQFYDLDNEWGADLAFCADLAAGVGSVLDLGCGTGRLIAHLSEGRDAVGADPAEAMLEIARVRPGGDKAEWIASPAQTLRLGRTFDLIVLTGHAFQVFLTDADQRAVLATIAAHLAPDGRFVFDSRNPAITEWRDWTPAESGRVLDHPELGLIEAWNDVTEGPGAGVVTYRTFYREAATGRLHEATSMLRFTPRERLSEMIGAAGLTVERWMGDWEGSACDDHALDFIPIGRLLG